MDTNDRTKQEMALWCEVYVKAITASGKVTFSSNEAAQAVTEFRRQFPLPAAPAPKQEDLDIEYYSQEDYDMCPELMREFRFGKNKGKEIGLVARQDPEYLKWCVENLDDSPTLHAIRRVRAYLENGPELNTHLTQPETDEIPF